MEAKATKRMNAVTLPLRVLNYYYKLNNRDIEQFGEDYRKVRIGMLALELVLNGSVLSRSHALPLIVEELRKTVEELGGWLPRVPCKLQMRAIFDAPYNALMRTLCAAKEVADLKGAEAFGFVLNAFEQAADSFGDFLEDGEGWRFVMPKQKALLASQAAKEFDTVETGAAETTSDAPAGDGAAAAPKPSKRTKKQTPSKPLTAHAAKPKAKKVKPAPRKAARFAAPKPKKGNSPVALPLAV